MIIVYGGSFNPPTKAHLAIIQKLNDDFKPNKLIVLPTGSNYTWKNNLIDFKHRKNMLELMLNKYDNVVISTLEAEETFKGTFDTLEKISLIYPNEEIYFVIGTDNLEKLDKWIKFDELIKKYGFIIMNRPMYHIDTFLFYKHQGKYKIMDFDSPISSTLIRENIEKYKTWLDILVYEYIETNKLYKGDKI